MDINNIQSLIKEGKIVKIGDIDPNNSYFQIGVYQTGNRKNFAGNANTYTPYTIPISDIISPTFITSLTTIGDGGAATVIGNVLNIPIYQTRIPHLNWDNSNKTIWNNGPGNQHSNTSFGESSLGNNLLGNHNTAIGYNTLYNVTYGSGNTAVGTDALYNNILGSYNVAIGMSVLFTNDDSFNIGIGALALTNSNSSNCIAIGYFSGNAVTSESNNILIGNAADIKPGNDGCIIIGHGAKSTAPNQFVIGSFALPAGEVATEANTSSKYWEVLINGTLERVLLK